MVAERVARASVDEPPLVALGRLASLRLGHPKQGRASKPASHVRDIAIHGCNFITQSNSNL